MIDDFHLFGAADDAGSAIDADIALIAAYLARELSLVQIVAIQERLATDRAFREKVQPIIEGLAVPGAWDSRAASSSRPWDQRATSLTRAEIEAGWQRHLAAPARQRQSALPARAVAREEVTLKRRTSMTRIAAVVTMIVLPVLVTAQLVVYAANHVGVAGHGFAQSVVPSLLLPAKGGTVRIAEGPAQGTLTLAQRLAPTDSPATRPNPDRAAIAALAKEHQPAVVRGDVPAEYIVMVLDAADKYVWSTSGAGNLTIEVGGDPRTVGERNAYLRDHRADFMGPTAMAGDVNVDFVIRDSVAGATASGQHVTLQLDSLSVLARRMTLRYDSLITFHVSTAGGSAITQGYTVSRYQGTMGAAGAGRGGRGRGAAGTSGAADSVVGSYNAGLGATRNGAPLNQAPGLQDQTPGQSGIQGLPSSSVWSAEMYLFAAGELAPRALQIMVVRLTPGSTWKGRQ